MVVHKAARVILSFITTDACYESYESRSGLCNYGHLLSGVEMRFEQKKK